MRTGCSPRNLLAQDRLHRRSHHEVRCLFRILSYAPTIEPSAGCDASSIKRLCYLYTKAPNERVNCRTETYQRVTECPKLTVSEVWSRESSQ